LGHNVLTLTLVLYRVFTRPSEPRLVTDSSETNEIFRTLSENQTRH